MARPTIREVAPLPETQDSFVAEYRGYLAIDKNALDDALQQQADLYFQVSQEYALALSLKDEAKEAMARQDAACGVEYRQSSEKANESMIRDFVAKDMKHVMAYDIYMKRTKRAGVLFALQEAFSQRGYAIRYLCNLYQAGYYTAAVKAKGEKDLTAGQAAVARAAMSRDRKN